MPFVYVPDTFASIADKLDRQASALETLDPCHSIDTPLADIESHRAKLNASAAANRRAAEILRTQTESER